MIIPDEVKDRLYKDIGSTIESVPRTDKLIVLGDFHARVSVDH
jgi:hypothetical protein